MKRGYWIALAGGLMLSSLSALAQTKVATTIGQVLLIEPSARAAAMGNAGVTVTVDAFGLYFNPGLPATLERSAVAITYSRWLADLNYTYTTALVQLGSSALSLALTTLNSGEMEVRTVEQPLGTGERFTVEQLVLGLGFSRRLTDRFSAGVQVKWLHETIWHSSLSALALDVGVFYELPFRAYLGASLSNFGTRGRYDGRDLRVRYDQDPNRHGDNSNLPAALHTESYQLPILFRVGMGLPLELGSGQQLLLVADAFEPSFNTESISLGAEWQLMNVLALRAGYQNLFEQDSELGLTLGMGLSYEVAKLRFQFDYAWASHAHLSAIHRLSASIAF
ncbi:PorV/PorQ family protein [Rhodothermus bifroesti]|uniref:PorV/PorQ family protein n=1 Tax=Rhodothermus bifroesti TaxID=2823335 RepID=UPI001AEF759D|nr:PorV/PorQ family protein [Rhodothermus bifroesti]